MEPETSNLFDLVVDQPVNAYLTQTAKWGKFLSIIGMIFCGLIILVGLFAGTFMSTIMFSQYSGLEGAGRGLGILVTVMYVGIGIIALMPSIYLYRYSAKMKAALASNDQLVLADAFKNLKSMFKFYGICTIILLGFYALILVFAVIARLFVH